MLTRLLCLVIFGASILPVTYAAEAPRMHIQVRNGQQSGKVPDGTRLARGRIAFSERHNGFRVWSDATAVSNRPQSYVLTAKGQSHRRLQVRLEGVGWITDTKRGRGIVRYSAEPWATFDVLVDGDQTIGPDIWNLQLQGVAILP